MDKRGGFYGWKLVGVLWLLYLLNMGFPLYGGIVMGPFMLKDIHMTRGMYGIGFTLLNIFIGVFATLIASVINRWGIKASFLIGSALIFIASLWMRYFVVAPWQYFIGFGVMLGTGIGFGTMIPVQTGVARWFRRYRGRAMAIVATAGSMGGFVGAPIMTRIVTGAHGNWRLGWLCVAGVALLCAVLAWLGIKESPDAIGQTPDGLPEGPATGLQGAPLITRYAWTTSEAYRTRSFWMLFIGAHSIFIPFSFMASHWIMMLRGKGISPAAAAWTMSLYALMSIAGRLLVGPLLDKVSARALYAVGAILTLAGIALSFGAQSLPMAYASAALMGLGFGWNFVCQVTALANYFGVQAFAKLQGLTFFITGFTCSPVGIAAGMLFDHFKSYNLALGIIAAICTLSIAAILLATPPKIPKKGQVPSPSMA